MRKPKSVVFLMIFFGWSAGMDLNSLVKFSILADYSIYLANDIPWMFFVFSVPIFALNILALYSLFSQHWLGLHFAFLSLATSVVHNLTSLLLSLKNLPAAKEAYMISRGARGLTVPEDAIEKIFSVNTMLSTMAVMLAFYVLVAFFVYKNKEYFRDNGSNINA